MKSRIFELGGGAGIGSYVIVMKNGALVEPNPLRIRQEFDAGNTLYLSIIDDTTQQALMPLTGYVDTENKLHLTCRDFDDVKTYDLTVEGKQPVVLTPTEGVTIGGTTIPTSEGASFEVLSKIELEDENYLRFPKNILPLFYYIDDLNIGYYFDYPNGELIDESGTRIGVIDEIAEDQIAVELDDFVSTLNPQDDHLDYLVWNGSTNSDMFKMNTLNLYHPQTQADFTLNDLQVTNPDGSSTHVVFPQGIIPLMLNIDTDKFYFNYPNECLVNASGEDIDGYVITCDAGNEPIYLDLDDRYGKNQFYSCIYLKMAGEDSWPVGNTYMMLFPASASGGKMYQHTIRISAWSDTDGPDGMSYDDVIFKITTSSPTPFTLATFKANANRLPLEGAQVFKYFCGSEDSSYYGGMIRDCGINSVNQKIEMTVDLYDYGEVTPKINASWTTLGDDVIEL